MKKQYRLATFALSACLLTGCGVRETNATQNSEAESQTENTINIDTEIDAPETCLLYTSDAADDLRLV